MPTFNPNLRNIEGLLLAPTSSPVTSILAAFRQFPLSFGDSAFDYESIGRGFTLQRRAVHVFSLWTHLLRDHE